MLDKSPIGIDGKDRKAISQGVTLFDPVFMEMENLCTLELL